MRVISASHASHWQKKMQNLKMLTSNGHACDPRAQVMSACLVIHLGPNRAEKRMSRTFAGSPSETIATL